MAKKIIFLIVGLCISPFTYTNSDDHKQQRSLASTLASTAIFASSATVASSTIAALVAYFKARNRDIATNPTELDLTCFGNQEGQPIIYSHGFGGNLSDIYYYTKQNNPFQPHFLFDPEQYFIATFNYPDATTIRQEVKYDQVTLAQDNDINRLDEAINAFQRDAMVGFGISRGAATFINMMGIKKNQRIKALILEAPFATVHDVLAHFIEQTPLLYYVPLLEQAAYKIAGALFPQYNAAGPQPIDTIDQIPLNVPILLIHSVQDEITPINSSRQLYIKRKQEGCDNVYLAELPSGKHVYCLWQQECDTGKIFQNVVHAFLKEYGFPHDPVLANQVNLTDYQPSAEEVEKRIGQESDRK